MLRKIFYSLPPNARFLTRRLYYYPTDLIEYYSGKRDQLTPPKGLIYTGSGDFKAQGKRILQNIIELADLQPDQAILDVGSGIGRLAVALTDYLNSDGYYEGFDVIKVGVDWCNKKIAPNYPNFNFKYIDLKNDLYRNNGDDAQSFIFPYSPNSFNVVSLISVFTHMVPDEVAHYLKEISKVLEPGGKCFATFFLYDKQNPSFHNPAFQFPYAYDQYRLMDDKVKSANVAFDISYLRKIADDANLNWIATHKGYWNKQRSKEAAKDFQDIVILEKKA